MSKSIVCGTEFERTVRKRLATSGGGHTLCSPRFEMILALNRSRVSDVGHSADVMKKMDSRMGIGVGGSPLKPKAGLNGPPTHC
jgi:hypothetical protein